MEDTEELRVLSNVRWEIFVDLDQTIFELRNLCRKSGNYYCGYS